MILTHATLLIALVSPAASFEDAERIPGDVLFYLHVDDAAEVFRSIRDRPITRWCEQILEESRVRQAWADMAQQSGVNSDALFDHVFSGSITLITRSSPVGEGGKHDLLSEWVLISQADAAAIDDLIGKLKPRMLLPRHGFSMMQLPEHELSIARAGDLLLVSPAGTAGLLDDVLEMRSIVRDRAATLASHPSMGVAQALGERQIELFLRHDPPMGGWSVAVADLNGDEIIVTHAAQFDSPPFTKALTQQTWDLAPLQIIGAHAIAVVMEPADIGESRAEVIVHRMLGRPLLNEELHRRVSARAIALGEDNGRLREVPVDGVGPAIALCYQLHQDGVERETLDHNMHELIDRAHRVLRIDSPAPDVQLRPDATGASISVTPVARLLLSESPLVDGMSLCWDKVSGPSGDWFLISTKEDQLDDLRKALLEANADSPRRPQRGQWAGAGVIDGRSMAVLMRGMADQPLWPLKEEQAPRFSRTMEALANLADGVEHCNWRLERPAANSMRLQVEIRLSPAESAAKIER